MLPDGAVACLNTAYTHACSTRKEPFVWDHSIHMRASSLCCVCVSKLCEVCVERWCVTKLCVSKFCVTKLCVSVCEQVVCERESVTKYCSCVWQRGGGGGGAGYRIKNKNSTQRCGEKCVVFWLVCACYHWEQNIKNVKCLTEVDPDKNPRLAPSSSSSESPSPRKAAKPLAEEHPDICQRHRRHRFQSNGLKS